MGIWGTLGVMALTLTMVSSATIPPYTNHTVGGTAGWIFNENSMTPSTNYNAWASNQTFNLGDFLIFNTDNNATVIQTYSNNTYSTCNYDDSGNDTFVYSDPASNAATQVVAVPLTQQGPNYFFSDADDGDQCVKGMKFAIDVKHGQGLPPSLNQPPPPPYSEPPSPGSQNSNDSTSSENNQGQSFNNGGSTNAPSGGSVAVGVVVALLLRFSI